VNGSLSNPNSRSNRWTVSRLIEGSSRNTSRKFPGAAEMIRKERIDTPSKTGIDRMSRLMMNFNTSILPPKEKWGILANPPEQVGYSRYRPQRFHRIGGDELLPGSVPFNSAFFAYSLNAWTVYTSGASSTKSL